MDPFGLRKHSVRRYITAEGSSSPALEPPLAPPRQHPDLCYLDVNCLSSVWVDTAENLAPIPRNRRKQSRKVVWHCSHHGAQDRVSGGTSVRGSNQLYWRWLSNEYGGCSQAREDVCLVMSQFVRMIAWEETHDTWSQGLSKHPN